MRRLLILATALFVATAAVAAPQFPALTGRVVDNAYLLSPGAQQQLSDQLAAEEQATGNQLVVVTLPTLQGIPIEQYGYQLGRAWGIGQKGKNNGALLIVAPKERKVRIEVGYGLEGTLTDAVTSQIIQTIILPHFRQGETGQGIVAGTQAILSVMDGRAVGSAAPLPIQPDATRPTSTHSSSSGGSIIFILFLLVLFSQVVLFILYLLGRILGFFLSLLGFTALSNFMLRAKTRFFPADKLFLLWLLTPSIRIGGSGSGGGGFSGGGGSFGGGGSSGSW